MLEFSVDEAELVTALITMASTDYLNSINIQKGSFKQNRLPVTVKRDSKGNVLLLLDAKSKKCQLRK